MAGQEQEKAFFPPLSLFKFIECWTIRLWDYAQDAQEKKNGVKSGRKKAEKPHQQKCSQAKKQE